MDVRKKFVLQLAVLLGIIALLIALTVFVSVGNRSVSENAGTAVPDIDLDPINNDEDASGTAPGELEEDEVIGTLTLETDVPPALLINSPKTELLRGTEVAYKVLLDASWSKQLHPQWYPDGAHISPMVTWSHTLDNVVFSRGETSSDGMKLMAETGGTGILEREVQSLGSRGAVLDYAIGKVFDAPGTNEVTITLNNQAHKISVVSMIAPSPDWFISAHNVDLFEDGRWVDHKRVSAVLYDAGTDSGATFTADDSVTKPRGTISLLEDAPSLPIATFEFIRL